MSVEHSEAGWLLNKQREREREQPGLAVAGDSTFLIETDGRERRAEGNDGTVTKHPYS